MSAVGGAALVRYLVKPRVRFVEPHQVPARWHALKQEHHVLARCRDCKKDVAKFKVSEDGSHVRCLNCIRELGEQLG
jgi:ribosomal protein S27E